MTTFKQPQSGLEKAWVVALYFLPGIILLFALKNLTFPISSALGLDLWLTQIAEILVFLFGFQLTLVLLHARHLEHMSMRELVHALGLNHMSGKNMMLALIWGTVSVALLHGHAFVLGQSIYQALQSISLFAMPDWHYQMMQPPTLAAWQMSLLMIVILSFNVFSEEVYFRGYLFNKSHFFGQYTWIANGTLFIAYHIFQLPITYAVFPLGFMISGYFAWRRDIYGAMLIHLMVNVLGPALR